MEIPTKIPRFYADLEKYLEPNKVLVLYGPRRVGKTTLLNDYLAKTKFKYKLDSGEDIRVQEIMNSQSIATLKDYAAGYELIAIDEAQRISHIGRALKMLVDHVPNLRVIATGSSSFELAGQVGEPLTGRKTTLTLFPIAQLELHGTNTPYDLKESLPDRLVFGSYPDILETPTKDMKAKRLEELTHAYLFKDILELEQVKGSKVLLDLLRLLAFQVGSEVSLSELANQLSIDVKTVARYLDLFEKSFVVSNLRGFSRNLRKEVTQKSKYYFFDTGIRNAVVANFKGLEHRNDVGALWENFLVIERLKKRTYQDIFANQYFWRTWEQQEIDLVEERGGKLFGYEFTWSGKSAKAPSAWVETYPEATFEIVSCENHLSFII